MENNSLESRLNRLKYCKSLPNCPESIKIIKYIYDPENANMKITQWIIRMGFMFGLNTILSTNMKFKYFSDLGNVKYNGIKPNYADSFNNDKLSIEIINEYWKLYIIYGHTWFNIPSILNNLSIIPIFCTYLIFDKDDRNFKYLHYNTETIDIRNYNHLYNKYNYHYLLDYLPLSVKTLKLAKLNVYNQGYLLNLPIFINLLYVDSIRFPNYQTDIYIFGNNKYTFKSNLEIKTDEKYDIYRQKLSDSLSVYKDLS